MEQDLARPISTSETGTEAFIRCSAAATGHFAPPYDASCKGPGSSNAQDYYNASGYTGIDASQYASTYGRQSHEGHSSSTYIPVEVSSTLLCKHEPPSPQPGHSSSIRGHSLAYRSLTDEENKLINYLEMNFKTAANTNLETEYPNSIKEINDIYNLAVIWAKKFLKYIKAIDDFKQLDMETQITTLKTSIRSCGMTVAAYTFDTEQNCFVLQDIRTSVDKFLRIFGPFREMTERFVDTVQSMQDAFFKDPGLLSIFELVLIFSPAWDDLNQRKRLSDLQNKYLILLEHYLEAKYSFSKGNELFARVMQKFMQVKDVANERKEIIKQIGTDKLAPIAKEFFAVKTDTPKNE